MLVGVPSTSRILFIFLMIYESEKKRCYLTSMEKKQNKTKQNKKKTLKLYDFKIC